MLSPARRSSVTTLLVVAALLLVVANAIRYGVTTEAFFTRHEKTIDGIAKVLEAALLIAGAIASYFRFFKGRTFSERGELTIAVAVIPATATHHLHAVSVRLKNIGPVSIWDPRIRLRIQHHAASRSDEVEVKGFRLEPTGSDEDATCIIDSDESALYHAEHLVDTRVWAVRYAAEVRSSAGDTWFAMTTVANAPSAAAATAGGAHGG